MLDDMSTSPLSSASASASLSSLYDVSNAADGIVYKQQQQQQQQPTSSASQRFHPYLVAYGRDSSSSLTTPQSAAVDRDPSRGLLYVSDVQGPGTAGASAADSSYSGRRTHGHQTEPGSANASRRLREFIPDHKKDEEYWMKRQKNNEAAKRSREKRRINDVVMTKKILELTTENKRLRLELEAIKRKYGLMPDTPYPINDEFSGDRSVSPVCVGISSSDDSTPPSSSFALRQSVSRSSPSPPTFDRYYTEPTAHRPNHPEVRLLPSQVSCLSQQQYQPMDDYRHQLPGQQQFVMHPQQAVQTQHQQQTQQVPSAKNISAAVETTALLRPLQFTSTSAIPPANISYVQAVQPANGDHVSDPVCGKQLFQLKLRNSSLTEDVMSPTQTHALASAAGRLVSDPHVPSGHMVTVSAPELESLAFSDLSSDEEDEGRYRCHMLSSELPLNLTKRPMLWPPAPSKSPFSNSSGVIRQPVNSLRNNDSRSLLTTLYNRELAQSHMTESAEVHFHMHSSKDLFENSTASGSLSKREDHLPNSTIVEIGSEVSQCLSRFTAKSSTNTKVKLESGNGTSVKGLRPEGENCAQEREESTDLAVDTTDIQAQTPSRQVRGGVPLKVWHKRSAMLAAARSVHFDQEDFREVSATTSGNTAFTDDDDHAGTLAAVSPNSSPSSDSFVYNSSEVSDSDSAQAKHRERRMRNNMAAWKCRENRKLLTDLNLTAATILESENHKLKEELRSLSREVTDLKEIIGKKKETRNGTQFQGAI